MDKKKQTIEEQAFAYHVRGYNVLPVGQDKRPAIKQWKQWQTEQQTDEQVMEWFNEHTKYNVGIITGKISGLTVIDIDAKEDQANADRMLALFPETYTVQTPSGGYHLYYQYAEGFTVSANAYPQYPNVDIRGEAGYVVAPPSTTDKGEYKIIKDIPIAPFPTQLFPKKKPRKTLTEQTTAQKGSRNDNLASFIGTLLQSHKEEDWQTECLPATQRANKTYTPPLPDDEVLTTFNSIVKKERARREDLIISPIQLENGEEIPAVKLQLRKNGSGVAHKDMGNAMIVLSTHPFYKDTIKYNTFKQDLEYNGKPIEESDLVKIQHFMQTSAGLPSIGKEAVYSAVLHYAYHNKYDEAQDWLKSLTWDGEERLATWLSTATGVTDDEYHRGIGTQWFMGIINRIMRPGCIFDYMLVLVGAQGLGKTSLFRIIGGEWYKSFTGSVDNKDFYLALRGAIIIDLDEGSTLYKSEAIKIKSIITSTHDEFRAPYERTMKKYPRRFVFSMSTNDDEPFRDVTGNRRYWVLDLPERMVDFKWLEENRDQLFAEAYHYFKEKTEIAEVPMEEAMRRQEMHLPSDPWVDLIVNEVRTSLDYCEGSKFYSTTVQEVFSKIFPEESVARLNRGHEMRIASVLKKELGLCKKQVTEDGERRNRWFITDKKQEELRNGDMKPIKDIVDEFVDELRDDLQF